MIKIKFNDLKIFKQDRRKVLLDNSGFSVKILIMIYEIYYK